MNNKNVAFQENNNNNNNILNESQHDKCIKIQLKALYIPSEMVYDENTLNK